MNPYQRDLIKKHSAAIAECLEGNDRLRELLGTESAVEVIQTFQEIRDARSLTMRKHVELVIIGGFMLDKLTIHLRHPVKVGGEYLWLADNLETEDGQHAFFTFDSAKAVRFDTIASAHQLAAEIGLVIIREVKQNG